MPLPEVWSIPTLLATSPQPPASELALLLIVIPVLA